MDRYELFELNEPKGVKTHAPWPVDEPSTKTKPDFAPDVIDYPYRSLPDLVTDEPNIGTKPRHPREIEIDELN